MFIWNILTKLNVQQTQSRQNTHTHTHTTEQSVLCIIIYWHSTWRHLHRIKYLQFQMLFFLLHQNNRNKQTNNSKNKNDIFFLLLWVQSCDSYCYSMLSVFILFLIISFYSYFLYNMFSSEYAYACFVRVKSLKHIQ